MLSSFILKGSVSSYFLCQVLLLREANEGGQRKCPFLLLTSGDDKISEKKWQTIS